MRILLTLDAPGSTADVLVECDDDTPCQELEHALLAEMGRPGAALTVPGRRVGDDAPVTGTVSDLGLSNGQRVGIDRPDVVPPPLPDTGYLLHVVSGPDAGAVFALPLGTHDIGRSGTPSWSDHSLSRRHCRVTVSEDAVTVTDLGSSNGTRIEGRTCPPQQDEPWAVGELLEIGDSVVEYRPARGVDAAVEPSTPGWLSFLRPPRIQPSHVVPEVQVPVAPVSRSRRRIPVIAMIVPLVFGVSMALLLHMPTFLLFALMSPVMLGANYFAEKRGDAKDHRVAVQEYEAKLAAAQEKLSASLRAEEVRLREQAPDAAQTLLTCALPGRRLWERRRHDADALTLRLGLTDAPSTVRVTGGEDGSGHTLHGVPAGCSLRSSGVVGLAGPAERVDAVLRWVVVQLAAYHAPRDLALSFLTAHGGPEWDWLAWLPHARPEDGESAVALVGNDTETRNAQFALLSAMIKARREAARGNTRDAASAFPAHVVVLHGYKQLRAEVNGLDQLLEEGPEVGVYAVCTDAAERSLPESCTATLSLASDNASYAVLRREGEPTLPRILTEGVAVAWCDRVARAISPLKDVGARSAAETLPDSARLLDVIALDPPTETAVRARWAVEPRSTTMTLGVGTGGRFSLDLKADGPHGLIAGTTGSGKTELLQTMIASLAIANRPEELNFVLVDYKGDSAFKDCVNLPHTVGKVNDLDQHLVKRALASLQAELKFRKGFLADAAVKDIEDYQRLQAREPGRPPLPRLMLVIDEFAQLTKDLPEFVTGLVNIAQLGRSLGIHLMLATQRPSGVVSPEIRANTNMRIALRVNDAADSSDILDSREAAQIPKSAPGRAYARLGAGVLSVFQSGRVGGRRPGAVATDLPPPFLARMGWRQLGYAVPVPPRRPQEEVVDTDLAALVAAIRQAAAAERVPEQRRPWLEPLPELLGWQEHVTGDATRGVVPALPYGVRDLPSEQQQALATFDLDRDGHLLVVGSSRTGRSQVLRALAASIARLCDPSDVHLYGLECGSGALNPLVSFPHCGAVVGRSEVERASRLLGRLLEQMDERQQTLARHGYADIAEQRRSSGKPMPHIVLMLDRWEGFTTTLGEVDSLNDIILKLLREGASAGVHLIITGDRMLPNNTRVWSMTENKLCLQLADKADYGLAGLVPRNMPDLLPPGRGFAPGGLETQVFLLGDEPSGQAQTAALLTLGEQAQRRVDETTERPFRVDVLPTMLTVEGALQLRTPGAPDPFVLVGVGGDELTAYSPDFNRSHSFLVAGPGRSGRSSVLLGAADSALRTGSQVLVVAPRQSPLRDLEGRTGVLAVLRDGRTPADEVRELVEAAAGPVLIVVDDGEGLRDAAAGDFYLRVVKGDVPGSALLLGGHADGICAGLSGWQVEARKARQGLLLSPQGLSDGDLVGLRLPRSILGRPVQPGRAWLHLGDGRLVQVATPVA